MTPERWQQIKPILTAARGRPQTGRREWLAEACGGDRDLMNDAESFLRYEDRLQGFIEAPVLSFAAAEDRDEAAVGRRIGPYRLVRLLGKGGMGAVYLAEREEEFEQRVALKVVRHVFAGPEMVRRFHAERQILARLEHPNIARLLDGGTTEDGVSYFAMELVDGVAVDRHCDEHRLTTRERLELFLQVCSALALAHQNLVVHRDLKPGNILVDASGAPKLLDFGIAKLLADGGDYLATPAQQRAVTLRYASPEQLRDEPAGTASDVYSLGLVLYKVLTGRLPSRLEHLDGLELVRAVCEGVAAPPSVAVLETEEIVADDGSVSRLTPGSVSRTRDGDVRTLRRRLAGDVDSIVAKALAKEPARRYASVEQLAADLRRHLDDLPVLARPGRLSYRAGKLVRRHRLGLAAGAAVLLLSLVFTAFLTRQLDETERARDQTEKLSTFLVDLFYASDPDRPTDGELTVRDLLDRGRQKLDAGLEREPEVRAKLLRSLGEVYVRLGDYAEARKLFATAIGLRRRIGGDHPELAAALNNLAVVHYGTGDLESAEERFRECIAMRRRLGLDDDLVKPMSNLAAILQARGELGEAEQIYRETLARRRATLGERHPNVADSLRSLATVLFEAGDLAAAEPLLRQSLAIRLEVYGPESTKAAMVYVSLGRLEHARGRLEEAEELYVRALEIRRRKLGENHHHTALAKSDLAALLLDLGETATAGVLLPQALETLYRVRPEDDWQVAEAESLLGSYLARTGRLEAAQGCLENAFRTIERQRGPQATDTRSARRRLADFYSGSFL
jgi:serine/threonine-protein kinase